MRRIRIGLACFLFSFALLTGNPISGALLRAPDYLWSRAIVFNAVRAPALCARARLTQRQVMVLFGCVLLAVTRAMVVRAKGTQWV